MENRPRLLIIDDDPALAVALSRLLRRHYDVDVAYDGLDALRRLAHGDWPDAILCDIDMPMMDGLTLHDNLPHALQRRMVFMSGGVIGRGRQRHLDGTRVPFVAKPMSPEHLCDTLDRVVPARA